LSIYQDGHNRAHLEPTWHASSPALALAVDF